MTKRAHVIGLDSVQKDLQIPHVRHEDVIIRKKDNPWFEKLDKCCIQHDACARVIPAKGERFGYANNLDYNVFDCSCDDLFSKCLKAADSYTADAVGNLYFNTLKPPCVEFPTEISHVEVGEVVSKPSAEHIAIITDTGNNDGILGVKPVERIAHHY